MTKIKRAKPAAVELHDDALDQAAGGGNTVYIGGAGGGVWKTTNYAIRGDLDVKPRT